MIYNRLVYDNITSNTTQSPISKSMFKSHRNFKPMGHTTFMKFSDYEFTVFIKKVKHILGEVKACLFGRKFSQVVHVMWTLGTRKKSVGPGLSFMDAEFNW